MKNPLLFTFSTPYEAAPFDQIKPEHFLPAIDQLIEEAEQEVKAITDNPAPPDFENTIVALEKSGEKLGRAVEILFNLNHAETTDEIQQIAQEVSPKLSAYSSRLMMNADLFKKIKTIHDQTPERDGPRAVPSGPRAVPSGPRAVPPSTEAQTVINNYYDDFLRNGAELDDDKKKRFAEIRSELSTLTLKFGDNVLAETNAYTLHLTDEADLAGLPAFVIEAAAQEAESRELEGWVFTLHAPSFVPFMKYSTHRELRKAMFMAYAFRSNQDNEFDNKENIRKIVNLRLELAQLMGEKNYATYVLKKRMAETPETVNSFINSLHLASRPFAEKEYAEVTEFAKAAGHPGTVERWDWAYWSEQLRKSKYDISDEEVKPYFQLEKVTEAIFGLANQLYDLSFEPVEGVPVYHPEVQVVKVLDGKGQYLALLYLDFFPRKGKQGGAWMTDFKGQDKLDGQDSRPHVSLVCNFTRPTKDKPSLLTFDEVNTYLHEFGHGLHGMLSQCTYPSVAGTNVYRDFVELPSQLMENWLTEKEWLDQVAMHYQTGEKMPAELLQRLVDAKNFQAGYLSERQLSFGMNDMAWHSITEPFTGDVIAFEKQSMEPTELFPPVSGSSMSCAFAHIFAGGYAAGYYGYKWSEGLDAYAFAFFKEKGIFDKSVAHSFRVNVLERGGSEAPMELYKRFRGQEPSIEGLLERSGLVGGR